VAKHSGCSIVRIDLHHAGSQLRLTVSDNGKGFDPNREADGQGCPSMRRRAHRLGGQLDIVSAKGLGTTVTLVTLCDPARQPRESPHANA
jgi:signal transduction histidine kinase